jgi:hypothetical protein
MRENIHGHYHDYVADKKEKAGNYEGAQKERERAQEKYRNARDRSP